MIVNSDSEIIARMGVMTRWDFYTLSLSLPPSLPPSGRA